MSHVSRTPPTLLEPFATAMIEMAGAAEQYAEPKVLLAAACELVRFLRVSVAGLAPVPPGAAGGFLQPPHGSHFGAEG